MKILLPCFILLITAHAIAQNKPNATISGQFGASAGKTLTIIDQHRTKHPVVLDKLGNFKASLSIDSGYYAFNGASIYLEPGCNLTIIKKDTTYTFKGTGAAENQLSRQLSRLHLAIFPYENSKPDKVYALEPADFLKKVELYQSTAYRLLDSQKLMAYFTRTQKQKVNYVLRLIENNYHSNYGIDTAKMHAFANLAITKKAGQTNEERLTALMAASRAVRTKILPLDIRADLEEKIWGHFDMSNEAMFRYSPEYVYLLDKKLDKQVPAEIINEPSLRLANRNEIKRDIVKKAVSNPYIQEQLYYRYTSLALKTGVDKDKDNYYNVYLKLAKDSVLMADITKTYNNWKSSAPGLASADFSMPDINNNTVTLSSFKGKYVYIDLWATWCGPCIAEIPALKQIEQKYSTANIAFVSISIDKPADKKKWQDYVRNNHLEGTQLIAENAWESAFVKQYGVASIPRFILIDPEGKIVAANALRPSNPGLQKQLDGLLK